MWLFGNANQKEIKQLKKQGWEVQKVDVIEFNKALDPKYNPKRDPELKTALEGDDVMIAVFVDNNITEQLTQWHNEEKARYECRRRSELRDLRILQADQEFAEADTDMLEIPEDSEVVGTDGWEYDGDNTLIRKFYFSNPDGGDSLIGSFVVTFKNKSDRVIDVHSNIW